MANSTSFQIDIGVQGAALAPMAATLDELATKLTDAGSASTKAAAAVSAGEKAYKQAESAAIRNAQAVEKISQKLREQYEIQAKAKAAAGDDTQSRAYIKASETVDKLAAKLREASDKSTQAAAAAHEQGTALDSLRASSSAAEDAVASLSRAQAAASEAAKKSAEFAKLEAQAVADAAKIVDAAAQREAAAVQLKADKIAAGQKRMEAGRLKDIELSKKATSAAMADAEKQAAAQSAALGGSGKANEAAEAFGKLGGPVGMLGQKAFGSMDAVKKLFGSIGSGKAAAALAAVGVVGVVVALVAMAAAFATSLVKIGLWAIGMGDATRSAGLLSAGIAGSVAGGAELEAKLDSLQNKLPQSREELQGMAGDLAKTGLKGAALSAALEDAATKAARVKFGPDFAKQVNALPNLSKRFQQNIQGIFGGLNLDNLLAGLGDLVNLFDKNTATGKAIKVVFESLFQPAIDGVSGFIPKVVSAFIQFEIWVLKALIAIKPFGSKIEMVGQFFVSMGVVIAATAAISIGLLVALAAAVMTPVLAFQELWTAGQKLYDKLSGMSFSEIGSMLIDGLVGGITGGIDKVIGAVTGVATSAISAAKSVLGIASPSKVFAQIGSFTAEGMAGGVDDGAGQVQSSLESLVAPPAVTAAISGGSATPSDGASSSSSSGGSFNFAGAQFTFNGVANAEEAEGRFSEMLTKFLQGDAAQLGGEVPA